MSIDQLSDSEYESSLKPIFEYLRIQDDLKKSDAIFVFGSRSLPVVGEAARLWKLKLAPVILCTGKNAGANSKYQHAESEADFMAGKLIELGVPSQNIIREQESTNTLENIIYGVKLLRERQVKISAAILVAKPPHLRRCVATFNHQFPEIAVLASPPEGSIIEVIDRPRREYAERLIAEVERLRLYADKGDITKQNIPDDVRKSVQEVEKILKYT